MDCPACGGPVAVSSARVRTIYCDYCAQPLLVVPDGIEANGTAAALADMPSAVSVGDRVTLGGVAYDVAGRVQYDFEDGVFDQYYLAGGPTDGAWFEQDEGRIKLFDTMEPVFAPDWDALGVGESVLVASGSFYPMEFGEGHVLGGAGVLPMRLLPGEAFTYVDGTWKGQAATLKYTAEGIVLLSGRTLTREQIQVQPGA